MIPFATGSCGYTLRFAKYVVDLLRGMTLKDTANLLDISWDTSKRYIPAILKIIMPLLLLKV